MTDQIRAPWTPGQVAALNRFQRGGGMHPFTCGGDHVSPPHLVARPDGWHCPGTYQATCDYRQDWAHRFMADPNAWAPRCSCGGRFPVHHLHADKHEPVESTPARTTRDNPATSSDTVDNPLREQYAAAVEADAERPRDQRVGIINAVLAVRDREVEQLRNQVKRLGLMIDEYGAGAGALTDKIKRVRKAVHVTGDEDVTDWQRGYRACSERALAALNGKEQQ